MARLLYTYDGYELGYMKSTLQKALRKRNTSDIKGVLRLFEKYNNNRSVAAQAANHIIQPRMLMTYLLEDACLAPAELIDVLTSDLTSPLCFIEKLHRYTYGSRCAEYVIPTIMYREDKFSSDKCGNNIYMPITYAGSTDIVDIIDLNTVAIVPTGHRYTRDKCVNLNYAVNLFINGYQTNNGKRAGMGLTLLCLAREVEHRGKIRHRGVQMTLTEFIFNYILTSTKTSQIDMCEAKLLLRLYKKSNFSCENLILSALLVRKAFLSPLPASRENLYRRGNLSLWDRDKWTYSDTEILTTFPTYAMDKHVELNRTKVINGALPTCNKSIENVYPKLSTQNLAHRRTRQYFWENSTKINLDGCDNNLLCTLETINDWFCRDAQKAYYNVPFTRPGSSKNTGRHMKHLFAEYYKLLANDTTKNHVFLTAQIPPSVKRQLTLDSMPGITRKKMKKNPTIWTVDHVSYRTTEEGQEDDTDGQSPKHKFTTKYINNGTVLAKKAPLRADNSKLVTIIMPTKYNTTKIVKGPYINSIQYHRLRRINTLLYGKLRMFPRHTFDDSCRAVIVPALIAPENLSGITLPVFLKNIPVDDIYPGGWDLWLTLYVRSILSIGGTTFYNILVKNDNFICVRWDNVQKSKSISASIRQSTAQFNLLGLAGVYLPVRRKEGLIKSERLVYDNRVEIIENLRNIFNYDQLSNAGFNDVEITSILCRCKLLCDNLSK